MNKIIIWILVIIVVIFGLVALSNMGDRNEANLDINENTENSSPALEGANAVNVDDQPIGRTVAVSLAVLEGPGFVAIHEKSTTGNPGPVVGVSALLPAGTSNNTTISLRSGSLEEGKEYIAMLHLDNGDGTFSETGDAPAKDSLGNNVMMEFEASEDVEASADVSL